MKRIFSPNNILNESLEINSEFEIAFANKISNAIPINATIVITYFNLVPQGYEHFFQISYARFYQNN